MDTFVLAEAGLSLVLLFQYMWGINYPVEGTIWLERLAWCGYFGKCHAASHSSAAVMLSMTCIWVDSSYTPLTLGGELCIQSSGSVGNTAVSK